MSVLGFGCFYMRDIYLEPYLNSFREGKDEFGVVNTILKVTKLDFCVHYT